MLAFKSKSVRVIALKGEHALDAFAWIEFKTIIPRPVWLVLKSIVYCENALGIFTRVANDDVTCVFK